MWIWREDREDTGGGAFDRADRADRAAGGWHGAPAGGRADWRAVAEAESRAESRAGSRAESWADETPIFHAVSDDHSRRAALHQVEGEAAWAAIPEPHPGSGAIPVQDRSRVRSNHLAAVPTVPPPSVARDDLIGAAASPEDELRRRAERRRRPQARADRDGETGGPGAGRHALRSEERRGGRHALGG